MDQVAGRAATTDVGPGRVGVAVCHFIGKHCDPCIGVGFGCIDPRHVGAFWPSGQKGYRNTTVRGWNGVCCQMVV